MISWGTDIIITFLEAFCCQLFFDVFEDDNQEKEDKKYKALTVILLGIFYLADGFVLSSNFILRELAGISITALIMFFIRNFKIQKACVLSLLFFGLLVAVEYFAYIFMQIVVSDKDSIGIREKMINSFIAIVDLLILFLTILSVRRLFRKRNNKILYDEEWIKFIIFPTFTIIVIAFILSSFKSLIDSKQINTLYVISLGLVVMNFFVFYFMEDIAKKGELLKEKEILEMQSRNQLEMYNALNENYKKQKSEGHEFKNHILCIQSLLNNEEYEDLKKYVKEISKTDYDLINVIDTNNSIVNAILNTKYREAANKRIVFTFRVNDLSGIKIKEKDIVVLLSNLLNNAIEACEKLPDKRVIKLKFMIEENEIILSVKNTFDKTIIKDGEDFLTTKEIDREYHGIGIKNVIRIVEKYKGFYSTRTDNDEFCFSVIIPV